MIKVLGARPFKAAEMNNYDIFKLGFANEDAKTGITEVGSPNDENESLPLEPEVVPV